MEHKTVNEKKIAITPRGIGDIVGSAGATFPRLCPLLESLRESGNRIL